MMDEQVKSVYNFMLTKNLTIDLFFGKERRLKRYLEFCKEDFRINTKLRIILEKYVYKPEAR